MDKDFDNWCKKKKALQQNNNFPLYKEREVWWCSVGVNIHHEIDGKGIVFSRPVLVLRKYNKFTFLGIPLTSKNKAGWWYVDLGFHNEQRQSGVISQVRTFSSARLVRRMMTLPDPECDRAVQEVKRKLFRKSDPPH